ncbi:hypothetical protein HDU93_005268 [Gonapodya sp. JEL0774]|nr:hypothetical protein HDU93_005268 [Gonapodya sp. JEL0774]
MPTAKPAPGSPNSVIVTEYDLNDAFDMASQDDEIKVIVLCGGNSPHFSAGHDLADKGKSMQLLLRETQVFL